MKSLIIKGLISCIAIVVLMSCSGDNANTERSDNLVQGKILSYTLIECYCCPGVTIETEGRTFFTEDFPKVWPENKTLPIDTLIEISPYSGNCPNIDVSVKYLNFNP